MTDLIQPADVSWFSSIKKGYNKYWNDWYISSNKTYTASGNMKSPGYVKCVQWVDTIWEHFNSNTIKNSFKICGIHTHTILNDAVIVMHDNLHSVLKKLLEEHVITNSFITDDTELVEAEDMFSENDPLIFASGIIESPIIDTNMTQESATNFNDMYMNDEEIEIIERMGQNLMSSESESESNYENNQKIVKLISSAPIFQVEDIEDIQEIPPVYAQLRNITPSSSASSSSAPTNPTPIIET